MATTADFKIGMCIEQGGDLLMILDFQRFQTGRGGSNVRTRMRSLNTGKTLEHTYTGGEKIEIARIERRPHQFLYKDETGYIFMNTNTYDQVAIQEDLIDGHEFLKDGDPADIVFHADREIALSCELPSYVELEVTYTEPGVSGNTATNTLKPAVLETGAEIRVPLFVNQGDKIRVDTKKKAYYERVK